MTANSLASPIAALRDRFLRDEGYAGRGRLLLKSDCLLRGIAIEASPWNSRAWMRFQVQGRLGLPGLSVLKLSEFKWCLYQMPPRPDGLPYIEVPGPAMGPPTAGVLERVQLELEAEIRGTQREFIEAFSQPSEVLDLLLGRRDPDPWRGWVHPIGNKFACGHLAAAWADHLGDDDGFDQALTLMQEASYEQANEYVEDLIPILSPSRLARLPGVL